MFSYSNWEKVCEFLSSNYNCITADHIQNQPVTSSWVVIKHDVETNIKKALDIAKIEHKYGIKATYYFQSYLIEKNILNEIQSLGHEIAYHYDVLDANKGDYKKSEIEFDKILNKFESMGFKINTVCPHGNPIMKRKGWNSNKDFFRQNKIVKKFPHILDIVVQLPSIISEGYQYISDAGYKWKEIKNINTNDIHNEGDIIIDNYLDFFKVINKSKKIIVSTHPHRWEKSNILLFVKTIRFKLIRFFAKKISYIPFIKKIMSKFYYLAKKI